MYDIGFAKGVEQDLRKLRAYDRKRIMDQIGSQLRHEPNRVTKNRKQLRPLIAPWIQAQPVWELRIGRFRVFYDLDEERKNVTIQAVRHKTIGKKTEEIL